MRSKVELFSGMALLGLAGLLMKPLVGIVGPIEMGIARGFFAVITMFSIRCGERLIVGKPLWPLPFSFTLWQWIASVGIGLNALTFSAAITFTSTSNALLIAGSTPVYMLFIQLLVDRKRPSFQEVITAAIVLTGMLLFFREGLRGEGLTGMIAAVLSGFTFASYIYGQGKIGKEVTSQGESCTRGTVLLGYGLSVPIGLLALASLAPAQISPGLWQPLQWPGAFGWTMLALIGCVQTGLAGWLWSSALPKAPRLLAAIVPTLGAIYAPLLTLLAYGEPWPGRSEMIGVVLVHAGVLWAALAKARNPVAQAPQAQAPVTQTPET